MLLCHSHTSPYVRKVTVLLHETGLIELVRRLRAAPVHGRHGTAALKRLIDWARTSSE